jgi:activating signal cointegrator 1
MPDLKALAVAQPWATLIMLGVKRLETRGWRTEHRGPLAIHASRTFPPPARALCEQEPFKTLLRQGGYLGWARLPRGALLGTVELVGCTPVEELDLESLSAAERALGDYRFGRWAWQLRDPRPLAVPLPALGRLGVYSIPDFRGRESA